MPSRRGRSCARRGCTACRANGINAAVALAVRRRSVAGSANVRSARVVVELPPMPAAHRSADQLHERLDLDRAQGADVERVPARLVEPANAAGERINLGGQRRCSAKTWATMAGRRDCLGEETDAIPTSREIRGGPPPAYQTFG